MNCHKFVTATLGAVREEERIAGEEGRDPVPVVSAELQKLYDALALDDQLVRDPAREPQPIAWVRVHNIPDFVAIIPKIAHSRVRLRGYAVFKRQFRHRNL